MSGPCHCLDVYIVIHSTPYLYSTFLASAIAYPSAGPLPVSASSRTHNKKRTYVCQYGSRMTRLTLPVLTKTSPFCLWGPMCRSGYKKYSTCSNYAAIACTARTSTAANPSATSKGDRNGHFGQPIDCRPGTAADHYLRPSCSTCSIDPIES